jgi:hypothetical protein
MDSLRFSTARAATRFTHRDGFATAMCFARRRSLRRSRNAAIILPTTTLTRCARAPPLLLRPFSKKEGRSAPVTRATSPPSPSAVHRHGRRSLRLLSVVARFAHLPSRGFERCLRRISYPPMREPRLHWALRSSLFAVLRRVSYPPRRPTRVHWALRSSLSCGGFHTRRRTAGPHWALRPTALSPRFSQPSMRAPCSRWALRPLAARLLPVGQRGHPVGAPCYT